MCKWFERKNSFSQRSHYRKFSIETELTYPRWKSIEEYFVQHLLRDTISMVMIMPIFGYVVWCGPIFCRIIRRKSLVIAHFGKIRESKNNASEEPAEDW